MTEAEEEPQAAPPAPDVVPELPAPEPVAPASAPSPGADEPPPAELVLPAGWGDAARDASFDAWAESRRRARIRNEIYGAAGMVVIGMGLGLYLHTFAFLIIGLLAAGALLAYEILVSSFE